MDYVYSVLKFLNNNSLCHNFKLYFPNAAVLTTVLPLLIFIFFSGEKSQKLWVFKKGFNGPKQGCEKCFYLASFQKASQTGLLELVTNSSQISRV